MKFLFTVLSLVNFMALASQSDYSQKAFLKACQSGDPEGIVLFINDSNLTDQIIFDCLKMQRENKDSYITLLSSERFLLAKNQLYPLYHGAVADQVDHELAMLGNLYERDFKALQRKIHGRPYILDAPQSTEVKVFRTALHNAANTQLPGSLSMFVDYCALRGDLNAINKLRERADITYESDVPVEDAERVFFMACQEGNIELFLDLLVAGYIQDPSMKNDQCAKLTQSPDIMKALLHYPGTDVSGILPVVVVKGHTEVVRTILADEDITIERRIVDKCETSAIIHHHEEILNLLLEYTHNKYSGTSSDSDYSDAPDDQQEHRNSLEDVEAAKVTLVELGLVSPTEELVDRFVLQPEPLCNGSFGYVYRALDTRANREVAIKHIDLYKQDHLFRLTREIEIMKGLKHPNVVEYIDSYLMGDQLLIVMELMSGDAHLLNWETLDERSLAAITRQVVSALAYLHASNVIHRDVKPENILYNDDGVFKLADFGLSIKLQPGNPLAQSYVGTTEFLAPELVRGRLYNNKVDIWSLGVTAHELATGVTLYNLNTIEVFMKHINEHEPKIPNHLGDDLIDFLTKCLGAKPKNRPTTQELLVHPFLANVNDVDLRPILPRTLKTVSYENLTADSLHVLIAEPSLRALEASNHSSSSNEGPLNLVIFDFLQSDFDQYTILENELLSEDYISDPENENIAEKDGFSPSPDGPDGSAANQRNSNAQDVPDRLDRSKSPRSSLGNLPIVEYPVARDQQ